MTFLDPPEHPKVTDMKTKLVEVWGDKQVSFQVRHATSVSWVDVYHNGRRIDSRTISWED